ncbi:NAD(P)H-dependent oxidoreductase [Solirubrobacter sp. CPCC 204708]|uniref:FMN dependent NADH:quinone oxidoreductase n=1 Tax=Solirubrobacter deserti TaxID=2282478 RepID=A0ABT4RD71_9ACTN|nr:NAD(P)H-dependent oxidoreductase [Solirubrobacter deserti]MBE2317750.1 NAD(P)H-dependent oxidoreductase [Solirubrobacter deserti]MDA0136473.1 NAD(P)H-dependent oxidoreductase [Solirubrobacter deserti]
MHLLHIDSSIQGEQSVSRALSARAAQRWRAAHPEGTVTYRDLAETPPPHRLSFAVTDLCHELLDEIKAADTIVFGLPLYNFGAPSHVKAWVDHLIVPGIAFDADTREPFLTGKDFVVTASRGGGYGKGTPREGWDHAEAWLPHGIGLTGLEPRFITAELTLAHSTPAMAELIPLAHQSRAEAEAAIDALWTARAVAQAA